MSVRGVREGSLSVGSFCANGLLVTVGGRGWLVVMVEVVSLTIVSLILVMVGRLFDLSGEIVAALPDFCS